MTVSLGTPRRFAQILLAMATAAMPVCLAASAPDGTQGGQTQVAKPSPDIPGPNSLPATQPTNTADLPAKPAPLPQHLDVDFTDGKITIDATNASLSGVLHEIANKAAIKITGGVSDERVFGHYGPSSPAIILATLLDGTASNMLLLDDANGGSELVLTPRLGGPTPPNPLAAGLETTEDQDGRPTSRYVPPVRPFQPPGLGRGPVGLPPGDSNFPPERPGAAAAANRPDSSQSPGDNRTPQQIYDQLQNSSPQKPADTQAPQ